MALSPRGQAGPATLPCSREDYPRKEATGRGDPSDPLRYHAGMARQDRKPSSRGEVAEIIFEDEDLVVVEKPVGLPVIAPEGGRGKNLLDFVSARLKRKGQRGRAALVHRLDRDTSGIMVFATNARAKKILMDEWQERARDRRYVALVEGDMGGEAGHLDSWIAPAGPSRMVTAKPGAREALHALGSWKRIGSGSGYTLLEVALETGRKHQIRVQLAALGHPVAGDLTYGARSDPAGRLMLHASLLEIVHPTTNESRRFESPPPHSFRAALARPVTWRAQGEDAPEPTASRRGRARNSPRRN